MKTSYYFEILAPLKIWWLKIVNLIELGVILPLTQVIGNTGDNIEMVKKCIELIKSSKMNEKVVLQVTKVHFV